MAQAIPGRDPLPTTGEVTITAGANDIADTSVSVQVTLKERPAKWDASAVLESLPDYLRSEFKASKLGPEARENVIKIRKKLKARASKKRDGET